MKRVMVVMVAGMALSVSAGYVFEDGELTRTRPTDWLRARLETQLSGLTGHPEAMSYPYDSCLWAGTIKRMSDHGSAWWRYEQTGYYSDGLLRLGYALGDAKSVKKGEEGVAYTLAHQSADGLLGDECIHWNRDDEKIAAADGVGGDMWPQAVFFRAMKAYAEANGKEREVAAALAKYYLSYPAEHIAKERNAISIEGMLWAHARLGDGKLLALAEKVYAICRADPEHALNGVINDRTVFLHGVTWCENMKLPVMLYAATGKKNYLEDALRFENKLERDHLLPDGVPAGAEHTHGNNVNWGHETCDIADFSWALGYFLEATGEGKWADRIERAVFNAGAGCVTPDFKALQYFSNPNQVIATSDSNNNHFFFGSTWMQYRPTHETECCAGNVHRIWPNYVSRMWMKGADGAVIAALYGPSVYSGKAGGIDFTITEKTEYPYDGVIEFGFDSAKPVKLDFRFRRPDWCEDMKILVNGKPFGAKVTKGEFASVKREFRKGDVVRLEMAMDAVFHEAAPVRYVSSKKDGVFATMEGDSKKSQGVYVTRGPLLYALPIESDWQVDETEHANMRGKKSGNPDFKSWNIRPKSAWNYAVSGREAKELGGGKIAVKARKIRWELHENRMTPWIPENPEAVSEKDEMITLVPYGKTQLRVSVFPDFKQGASVAKSDWPVVKTYRGEYLRRVKLPIGGIGTGTISLAGRGALVDWEIKNTPAKGYVPKSEGSFANWWPSFAVRVKTADGKVSARLLEGPIDTTEFDGACGATVPNHGFPRFTENSFEATYPFARLRFSDPRFPVGCSLEAWNPLVPKDADASGIPGANLSYTFVNPTDKPVTVSVVGTLVNCAGGERSEAIYDEDGVSGIRLAGDGGGNPSTCRGSLALAVPTAGFEVTRATNVRGPGWSVSLDRFWQRFVKEGMVADQSEGESRHVAQLCVSFTLAAGETKTVPFAIGWSFADRHSWSPKGYNPWSVGHFEGNFDPADLLTNYYTLAYPDAKAATKALIKRREELYAKTLAFVKSVMDLKAPWVLKEAALFNLSTLRTETCFRTADGRFYGWEGIHDNMGSCYGSCNHVWGYEHCLVDLWPDLARTMLETSFGELLDERGHMTFRVGLPLAEDRARPIKLAAADGQFQTIVKAYEYVAKTKDDAWLKTWWPRIRRATEFCWIEGGWDADCDGVVEGCQHNTMDVEYYGPNPQMGFLYLAALEASAKMAEKCGDGEFSAKCRELRRRGSAWTEKNLFNGEWYEHIITPPKGKVAEGLGNSGMGATDLSDPDYQLGAGCLVDQLVGDYAAICAGLGPMADREHALATLKTILKRNRRGEGLEGEFNPMRGYALTGERSLRMAWYPEGRRPRSPFPYYGETMTGFEYVVAALLAQYGDSAAAEEVVQDIRNRYDGRKRNPFDEAECGHHYARALAAWSVLMSWTE